MGFEGESSNISPDGENDDYGGADFDIQGQVPGEPLVPAHAPAQPKGDADQTFINHPDRDRSDPTPPSSPNDDDQDSMYAPETPTRSRDHSDTVRGNRRLSEFGTRMIVVKPLKSITRAVNRSMLRCCQEGTRIGVVVEILRTRK